MQQSGGIWLYREVRINSRRSLIPNVRLSDSLATGHRVSYWLIAENDIEDLYVNVWCWGATMPLIHQSNILEPDVEVFGEQMVIAKVDSCIKLADWLELNILTNLPDGSRIKQSGMITNEPDDGTFHRDDLAENYSVDREWLLQFISFLRECGGFYTLG